MSSLSSIFPECTCMTIAFWQNQKYGNTKRLGSMIEGRLRAWVRVEN